MTAFTIPTRDNVAIPDAGSDVRTPATAGDRRAAAPEQAFGSSRSLAGSVNFEEASLPAVVLQLPDLIASGHARRGGRFRFSSQLYWVVLVLGALIALWLVVGGGEEPPEPSTSEAPSWTAPGRATTVSPSVPWTTIDSEIGSNQPQSASPALGVPEPAAPSIAPTDAPAWPDTTAPGYPAANNRPRAPGDGSAFAPTTGEARTARGGDTRWDGSLPAAKPGEAAPLGIATPEP